MERQRADVAACIKANRGIRRHGTIFLNPWIVNHARETDTIRGPVDRRVFFFFSFLFFSRDRTRWTNQRKLKVSPCLYLLYSRLFVLLLLRSFYFSFFLSLSFSSTTFSFSFILTSSTFPFSPYARKCSYFFSFPLILFICLLV